MKKKIKDLTIEEFLKRFCNNEKEINCQALNCPLWHGCMGFIGIKEMESEVEVDD